MEDINMSTTSMERHFKSTVLKIIKLLHGDYGVGSIQTCFKGTDI